MLKADEQNVVPPISSVLVNFQGLASRLGESRFVFRCECSKGLKYSHLVGVDTGQRRFVDTTFQLVSRPCALLTLFRTINGYFAAGANEEFDTFQTRLVAVLTGCHRFPFGAQGIRFGMTMLERRRRRGWYWRVS